MSGRVSGFAVREGGGGGVVNSQLSRSGWSCHPSGERSLLRVSLCSASVRFVCRFAMANDVAEMIVEKLSGADGPGNMALVFQLNYGHFYVHAPIVGGRRRLAIRFLATERVVNTDPPNLRLGIGRAARAPMKMLFEVSQLGACARMVEGRLRARPEPPANAPGRPLGGPRREQEEESDILLVRRESQSLRCLVCAIVLTLAQPCRRYA